MISYYIQVTLCSGLLYGYYHWVLRNKKLHRYNRYYLLLSMLLSSIVPFVKIPVYIIASDSNAVVTTLTNYSTYLLPEVVVTSSQKQYGWALQQLPVYCYIMVSIVLVIRMLIGIKNIIVARYRHDSEWQHRFLFIKTHLPNAPFSFFNWIFWNENIPLQSEKGQKIFRHEYYHVQQKHSIDVLLAEVMIALCWINPFFYFFKREIKAVHEFLADGHASKNDNEYDYAELLVTQALNSRRQILVHPFFNNQLKRRINMLLNPHSSRYPYLRQVMVLPLLAVIASLFTISCKSADEKEPVRTTDSSAVVSYSDKEVHTAAPATAASTATPTAVATPSASTGVAAPLAAKDKHATKDKQPASDPEILSKVEIDASYPGGAKAWMVFLSKNLRGDVPVEQGASAGKYTTLIQFIVDKQGNVSDVKPITNMGYGMEAEAMRVIQKSGKWKPAIQNGKIVKSYRRQPITFEILD